jgi:hypothetical protein
VQRLRVIFLDIDGVLNCKKTPNPRKLPYVVDPTLLRKLNDSLRPIRLTHQRASYWVAQKKNPRQCGAGTVRGFSAAGVAF